MSSPSDLNPKIDTLVTDKPINVEAIIEQIQHEDCGAQLIFIGTTRKTTNSQITESLSYDAYMPMAQKQLENLARQAAERWQLYQVVIHHRIGQVNIGQPSVVVAVASPHRKPSMEAVPWLMDQIKSDVPIWKQETYEDNDKAWVHPTN